MKLTVEIPDAHAREVLDAFARVHNYRPQLLVPDPSNPQALVLTSNPETPQQFAERHLLAHVRTVLGNHRRSLIELPQADF